MSHTNKFSSLENDESNDNVDIKYKSIKDPIIFSKKKFQKNHKKILCHNMITKGTCIYGNNCLYAHTLEDQNIETSRKAAWEILLSSNSLEEIDLQKNHVLYRSLLNLTQLCKECNKGKCTGGYNCKFGSYTNKYQICIKDLNYGECRNNTCKLVHLTSRKLKPFYNQSQKYIQKIKGTLLNDDFFEKNEPDDETLSNFSCNSTSDEEDENNVVTECDISIFD